MPVPNRLRSYVSTYKKHWQRLCAKEKNAPSLHDLLLEAKTIERSFDRVFGKVHQRAELLKKRHKKTNGYYDQIQEQLTRAYPSFIPAFEGAIAREEYFRPRTSEFAKRRGFGDPTDRAFFEGYLTLRSKSRFPWMKKMSADGGCLKFGEYPWPENLRAIQKLRNQVAGKKMYVRLLDLFENDILQSLTSSLDTSGNTYPVCSCAHDAAVVVTDLRLISTHLRSTNRHLAVAQKLDLLSQKIQKHEIPVRSAAKDRCIGSLKASVPNG